jgi:hypothetical protein
MTIGRVWNEEILLVVACIIMGTQWSLLSLE